MTWHLALAEPGEWTTARWRRVRVAWPPSRTTEGTHFFRPDVHVSYRFRWAWLNVIGIVYILNGRVRLGVKSDWRFTAFCEANEVYIGMIRVKRDAVYESVQLRRKHRLPCVRAYV